MVSVPDRHVQSGVAVTSPDDSGSIRIVNPPDFFKSCACERKAESARSGDRPEAGRERFRNAMCRAVVNRQGEQRGRNRCGGWLPQAVETLFDAASKFRVSGPVERDRPRAKADAGVAFGIKCPSSRFPADGGIRRDGFICR